MKDLSLIEPRKTALAISRVAVAIVIVIILIAAIAFAFVALGSPSGTSSSSSSTSSTSTGSGSSSVSSSSSSSNISSSSSTTSTSSSSSGTGIVPSSLTYETYYTPQYLDPHVDYVEWDYGVMNNIYEYLLFYNTTSPSDIIPWLAQSYTMSPDKLTVNFTLRSSITFQDGEQFNSTAVYFSIYRNFILDGAAPTGYGYGPAWIQQQLGNTSLSFVISGKQQPYSQPWVDKVLAENFVNITSPNTFTMNLQHFDGAFPYLWATYGAPMIAPNFTMQHDVATWKSAGYTLPYLTLSGDEVTMIKQYFYDEVSTCGVAPTPGGCGYTYLDGSAQGSTAGTGPYSLASHDMSTQNMVLQANPNYWGGPYQFLGGQKIVPQIKTININFVADQVTRELDLQNAATSGSLLIIDVTNDHLYDVANRTEWLQQNTLSSVISHVTLFGPYTSFSVFTIGFNTNVTNRFSGTFYKFQPFSDVRFRLAFADTVNMTSINLNVNNKLGQVMQNIIPPDLPPAGSYNSSIVPRYSYNLTGAQNLLLDMMLHPIASFTYKNGTAAPSGVFDNTFGCASLNAQNQCSAPVPQTVGIYYPSGDTFNEAILNTIAGNINNISSTYNMGLTVTVIPTPIGQMITEAFSGQLYAMAAQNWYADYPWVLDFVGPLLAPANTWYAIQGYNLTGMAQLYTQAVNYSHTGDYANLVKVSNQMVELANQEVMSLYTIYPAYFIVMTSNINGYFYNPSEPMQPGYYFATMT